MANIEYKKNQFYVNGERATPREAAEAIGITPPSLKDRLDAYNAGKIDIKKLLGPRRDRAKNEITLQPEGPIVGTITFKGAPVSVYQNGGITYGGSPITREGMAKIIGIKSSTLYDRICKIRIGRYGMRVLVSKPKENVGGAPADPTNPALELSKKLLVVPSNKFGEFLNEREHG